MIDLDLPADAAALRAVQGERRKAAVAQALRSPFMAARLGDVDPDRVCDPERWARLPVLDKDMLRAMSAATFYNDFCIGGRSAIAEYWRSGGSTGRPLFYPRTAEDIRRGLTGFARVLDCAGFTAEDVTHLSLPLGIHPAGHLMGRAASAGQMGVVWAGGGNTLPSAAQIELIDLFRPTAWIGMASYGLQLASLAAAQGIDLSRAGIGRVLCTAEPLSGAKRAKLAAAFGAEVRDSFGMTEVMMLGCEDGMAEGFRFWSDYCFPEVVDPATMEPVAPGSPGLLLVTALVTNNATPFLRWNTGDIVTMTEGGDGTGRYGLFPLVRHTHRTAGFVKVRGVNIGFQDFEDLMFATPAVADFRVEVRFEGAADVLDLHVELAEGAKAAPLADLVRSRFEITPRVSVLDRGTIARAFEASFKPARIVDLR
jgi:phenylacetate-CoA ligase